eukprot:gene16462-biopygen3307
MIGVGGRWWRGWGGGDRGVELRSPTTIPAPSSHPRPEQCSGSQETVDVTSHPNSVRGKPAVGGGGGGNCAEELRSVPYAGTVAVRLDVERRAPLPTPMNCLEESVELRSYSDISILRCAAVGTAAGRMGGRERKWAAPHTPPAGYAVTHSTPDADTRGRRILPQNVDGGSTLYVARHRRRRHRSEQRHRGGDRGAANMSDARMRKGDHKRTLGKGCVRGLLPAPVARWPSPPSEPIYKYSSNDADGNGIANERYEQRPIRPYGAAPISACHGSAQRWDQYIHASPAAGLHVRPGGFQSSNGRHRQQEPFTNPSRMGNPRDFADDGLFWLTRPQRGRLS